MTDNLQQFIAQAKIAFGEVYSAEVEDDVYIFRILTRREYREILAVAQTESMVEEIVCQVAVLYPEGIDFANGAAGLPSLLAPHILQESGFGGADKSRMYLDKYRMEMTRFEAQAEVAIQAAFPHTTDEEMQDWTVNEFMRKLARAEWLLQNVHGYPVSFQEQEAPEEEVEEQEPPTFKELGDEMRRNGLDPMIEYAPYIMKARPFAETPFIGGTDYWRRVFINGE